MRPMQLTACLAQSSMNKQVQKALFSSHWREIKSSFFVVFKTDVMRFAIWTVEMGIGYFGLEDDVLSFEGSGIVFDAFDLKCMI